MSISGSLEDASASDVLQFVHLGGRSGTLILQSAGARGQIGFHRGRIVNATRTDAKRIGELLVESNAISVRDLEAALRFQKRSSPPPALGRVLIDMGLLTEERLREVAERQIEQIIYDVVTWTSGTFEFIVDELKPVDDLSLVPGDILPDLHVNTQMVLLQAARIFDERSRSGANFAASLPKSPTPSVPVAQQGPAVDQTLCLSAIDPEASSAAPSARQATIRSATAGSESAGSRALIRLQLVSQDNALSSEVDRLLSPLGAWVVRVQSRDAGTPLPGEPAPVVLLDARRGQKVFEWLSSMKRARPRATFIAIVASQESWAQAYEAGAIAVVPEHPGAIVACVAGLLQQRQNLLAEHAVREGLRSGFAKLRRLFGEFRSGLVTATVSLNLMNTISESVERAILLLVRRLDLVVLGAFGHTADGRSLAEHTQGMRIALDEAGALGEVIRDGQLRSTSFDQARLPDSLLQLLGRPAADQCSIFPIIGGRNVVALVYADNGRSSHPIDEVAFLEVATSQVGVMYENELLRRQLGSVQRPETAISDPDAA